MTQPPPPARQRRPLTGRQQRALAIAALMVVLVTAGAVALTRGDPTATSARPTAQPPLFGYEATRQADYEQRAARGEAAVLYALSPGGVVATAARVARLDAYVQRAVRGTRFPADLVSGMLFLESAGRIDVVAGSDVAQAAGVSQILAQTATGLLGMQVDLAASSALTRAIDLAVAGGDTQAARRLQARRRLVDQRFDPARAIAGTVRYLTIAYRRFGRVDLAVESYHMGIGNLDQAVRLSTNQQAGSTASVVRSGAVSYASLYFDSSPVAHQAAHDLIWSFGDDSANYYWKVLAAVNLLHAWRAAPAALADAASARRASPLAAFAASATAPVTSYSDAAALARALVSHQLVAVPDTPAQTGIAVASTLHKLAARTSTPTSLYQALRPAALRTLLVIGAAVRRIVPTAPPLLVSWMALDDATASAPEARGVGTSHDTGYTFDILRRYASGRQARAFQFALDRLQALNEIVWVRTRGSIRITAAP